MNSPGAGVASGAVDTGVGTTGSSEVMPAARTVGAAAASADGASATDQRTGEAAICTRLDAAVYPAANVRTRYDPGVTPPTVNRPLVSVTADRLTLPTIDTTALRTGTPDASVTTPVNETFDDC